MSGSVTFSADVYIDVSVVVPCFRCVYTLERAIMSVLAQTELPKELILVDDASEDETLALLYSWRDRWPGWIRVIAQPFNLGAGMARNAGWAIATGKYVAFLDSDDSWLPQKLAIQYAYMEANQDVCLSGHAHAIAVEPNELRDGMSIVEEVRSWRVLAKNPFVTPSAMIRREVLPRFEKGRRYMEDHLLWMEVSLTKGHVVRLDAPLAILHKEQVGVAGLSSHIRAMSKADLENYWTLYRKGLLGVVPLLIFGSWACLKLLRREGILGVSRAWHWLRRF